MNENEIYSHSREMLSVEEREQQRNFYRNGGETVSPKTGRNEFFVKTAAVQAAVCIILILVLLLIRKTSPTSFELLKQKYLSLMKRDIKNEEIVSAAKSVAAFSFADNKAKSSDETETESEEKPTETAEAGAPASGGEDIKKSVNGTTFSPVLMTEKINPPLEEYTVTSRFGYRTNPITGEYGFHTGLDMAAPSGTEIKACFDGVVIETGKTEARGNYLVIKHSDSIETAYYHCEKILCDEGDKVKQGEKIALVGSTGWSTGPHLHFEVRIDSVCCDPLPMLNEN